MLLLLRRLRHRHPDWDQAWELKVGIEPVQYLQRYVIAPTRDNEKESFSQRFFPSRNGRRYHGVALLLLLLYNFY